MDAELTELVALYEKMQLKAAAADPTLAGHTRAIAAAAGNKAQRLVTKMKAAQRKRLEVEGRQIRQLKAGLFPGGSLQERTENIAGFYADYGPGIFDLIKMQSQTLEQQFGVIFLSATGRPA